MSSVAPPAAVPSKPRRWHWKRLFWRGLGLLLVAALVYLGFWIWQRLEFRRPGGWQSQRDAGETGLTAVAFSPIKGKWLTAITATGKLLTWDETAGTKMPARQASQQPLTALAPTPEGYFVTASLSGHAMVWQPKVNKLREVPRPPAPIASIAVSPNRPEFVCGLFNGHLYVMDVIQAKAGVLESGHKGVVKACVISRNDALLVTAGGDGQVVVRDARTKTEIAHAFLHSGEIAALCEETSGRFVSGDWNGRLLLWEGATAKIVQEWQQPDGISSVAHLAPFVVTGGWDGRLRFWREGQAKPVQVWDSGEPVHGLAVHPESRLLVTTGSSASLKFWTPPPEVP